MKRVLTLLTAFMAVSMLAGCKDASAQLKDAQQAVVTIGDKAITKGDLYSMMNSSIGAEEVYSDAFKAIAAQEVEITDKMREDAKSNLDLYKMMYGDQFTQYMTSLGLSEEDYMEQYMIPSMQTQGLTAKYIEENFADLVKEYNPIQAIILSFTTKDDASEALSGLKDGKLTPAQAASENNSSSYGDSEIITINTTSYDSAALSVIRSGSPDDGWVMVPSTDGATFYLVNIVSNNPEDYKEEVTSTLTNVTAIKDKSNEYYLRKYNFHIYDITVYNAMKDAHPEALVQDSDPAPAATQAPETTEAPEATEETK